MGTTEFSSGDNPAMDLSRNTFSCLMVQKPEISTSLSSNVNYYLGNNAATECFICWRQGIVLNNTVQIILQCNKLQV